MVNSTGSKLLRVEKKNSTLGFVRDMKEGSGVEGK